MNLHCIVNVSMLADIAYIHINILYIHICNKDLAT